MTQFQTSLILEISSVVKKLKALHTRKSSYPSEIPIKLIIECANLLSYPLTAIFNQIFIDGVFPSIFNIRKLPQYQM